jgi:hypothetical protein
MRTECSPTLFAFAPVEGRAVVAGFDGGAITSDASALLLGAPTGPSAWCGASPPASATPARRSGSSTRRPRWSASGCSALRSAIQKSRSFHGYYDRHLLSAKLQRSNVDASTRALEEVQCIVSRIRPARPGSGSCCGPISEDE